MSKFEIMNPLRDGQPITIWKQDIDGMHVFAYIEQSDFEDLKTAINKINK